MYIGYGRLVTLVECKELLRSLDRPRKVLRKIEQSKLLYSLMAAHLCLEKFGINLANVESVIREQDGTITIQRVGDTNE